MHAEECPHPHLGSETQREQEKAACAWPRGTKRDMIRMTMRRSKEKGKAVGCNESEVAKPKHTAVSSHPPLRAPRWPATPHHSNGNSHMALGDRRSEMITAGSALGCARGSHPRLGLAVRCGDLTLQRKHMPFWVFFYVQPKYQRWCHFR